MFVDEIEFTVRGGKGGDGCCSFRREKYVPRGGPDGGDGGRGGDVVLRTTPHRSTLQSLAGRRTYDGPKGAPGRSSDQTGASGDDLVLAVPVGTAVIDADRGNVLRDLSSQDEVFVVARGGRGGRGNARFATSTNRAPRTAERGRDGEERHVRLSLKLIADVGLVGLPNAGKSTLLAALSRARPKIAEYPFTTLEPCLGIVPFEDGGDVVLADIPGLIAGAHEGRGLGVQFLKHIERTKALLHLIDCSDGALDDPEEAYRVVTAELRGYSEDLAERPRMVVATKVEGESARARAAELARAIARRVLPVSSATRDGLPELLGLLGRLG